MVRGIAETSSKLWPRRIDGEAVFEVSLTDEGVTTAVTVADKRAGVEARRQARLVIG